MNPAQQLQLTITLRRLADAANGLEELALQLKHTLTGQDNLTNAMNSIHDATQQLRIFRTAHTPATNHGKQTTDPKPNPGGQP